MGILKNDNKLLKFNGKIFKFKDPYPPLSPSSIRLKYKEGVTPTFTYGNGVLIDNTNNIWDLTLKYPSWNNLLYNHYDLLEVLSADTTHVTSMRDMFYKCSSLSSVPLFNTSKASTMDYMFQGCINVQSGALALYQQASTQTTPPTYHRDTFKNCGNNTRTGSAELRQIPKTWGGTKP